MWGIQILGPSALELIGRPGTNGNRVRGKSVLMEYFG